MSVYVVYACSVCLHVRVCVYVQAYVCLAYYTYKHVCSKNSDVHLNSRALQIGQLLA